MRTSMTHRTLAAGAVTLTLLGAACASSQSKGGSDDRARAAHDSAPASTERSGTASSGDSARSTHGALAWAECKEDPLERFECATLTVPVDHANGPDARDTIDLAIIRQPAGDPSQRIGSLVMNPGGPGASGVDFLATTAGALAPEVRDRFDLVSFDPRGVGRSAPIDCFTDQDALFAMDPTPDTPEELAAAKQAEVAVTNTCVQNHGAFLRHISTVDAARDLELLRIALGDDTLSYLGFSYGTKLGATYASLYPERVRVMALDGAVGPTVSSKELTIAQAAGFDRAFDHFVDACDADPACPAYPDAAQLFEQVGQRTETSPIAVSTPGEARSLTPGYFKLSVFSALYSQETWWLLARGLADAERGDGATLLALADLYTMRQPDGTYLPTMDALTAINCADDHERAEIAAGSWSAELAAVAPRLGSWFAPVDGVACEGWPMSASPVVPISAPSAPPIVVIGTAGDPATPVEWAGQLAGALGTATVVTFQGEGHTGYLSSTCVADLVNAYLLDRTVPGPSTSCPVEAAAFAGQPFTATVDAASQGIQSAGISAAVADCAAPKLLAEVPVSGYVTGEYDEEWTRQAKEVVGSCQM